MQSTKELYETYVKKMNQVADLQSANAVLQWDQETYLPANGARYRGQQLSTLSELSHHFFSEDELGIILNELLSRKDLSREQIRNVELTLEDYTKNKKYSSLFVRNLSEAVHKSFHSWLQARKEHSFSIFEKDLESLIELKRQECDILGYQDSPYNALINEFEKGCTVSFLDSVFKDLLPHLKKIIDKIQLHEQVDNSFLKNYYPKKDQWEWGMYLIRQMGFDFDSGRQDISEHPFSTSFNACDVRITTRIDENDFGNMTWSCIHETGHGLYEQGLPLNQYGLPLGEACSYSIHESQSRLWENHVGRSLAFWKYNYSHLQQRFSSCLKNISLEHFYKGINKVEPSLIRTEADEITYHFHVFIRYELEKNLIEGKLKTRDIPEYWNSEYKKWLNVDVNNDKMGCLQDVHWSHGSFGYFPTYSLGSFYATQFFEYYRSINSIIEDEISSGNVNNLLLWLRKNIHKYGRYYESADLCKEVTGETLEVKYFVNYLLHKYGSIYNLH